MSVFFSVIIPSYQSGKTIGASVDSILNQHFTDFELLIIDGDSADETRTVIERYSDKRIRFISEKDKGVYDAMNKGIRISSGQYLYFLGADDQLIDNDVLQSVYNFLKESPADIVYGNAQLASNGVLDAGIEMDLEKLLFQQNINHQSVFYARSCFDKIGCYNLKYPVLADWDLNIRCFMHPDFTIKYMARTIALYNDISGMSSVAYKRDTEFLKILPLIRTKQLFSELSAIKHSREYGLGKKLMKPVSKILKLFKKG